MNKYTITQTWTPHNRKKSRTTTEHTFTADLAPESLELVHAHAALNAISMGEFKSKITQEDIKETENGIAFTVNMSDGEHYYEITLDTENITEYSKEAMVSWAETQIALNPTYNEEVYDEDAKKYITVTKTNTVERLLGKILLGWDFEVLMNEKAHDLRGIVTHLYEHGTKGYANMSRDELLAMIQDEIVEGCDCETVQDVLDTCNIDEDEDEDDE